VHPGGSVLVTGARGFIGSHVVEALARRGAEPVALEGDYHTSADVERALREVEPVALVHAAWRIAGTSYDDPAHLDELGASLRLFTAAGTAGCERIVGIGTCFEYDASDGPTREDAPLVPRQVYGAAKAALFLAARAWADAAGTAFAWARLYHVFGPREAPHRLVPAVVNALLRGERVATTAGRQRRSFVHVEDAADAIAAITLAGARGPFNVGSADVTSVRDVVERLARLAGRPDLVDVGALEPRPGDPEVLWPDVSRLDEIVGWRPGRTLDQGLEETFAWWRASATAP
jgi:nucleoside-diphosphate-sugar epimerase